MSPVNSSSGGGCHVAVRVVLFHRSAISEMLNREKGLPFFSSFRKADRSNYFGHERKLEPSVVDSIVHIISRLFRIRA